MAQFHDPLFNELQAKLSCIERLAALAIDKPDLLPTLFIRLLSIKTCISIQSLRTTNQQLSHLIHAFTTALDAHDFQGTPNHLD